MTPRTTTWSAVSAGKYVLDKQQKVWRVEDERHGQVLLQDAEGQRVAVARPGAFEPVTVMEPTHDEALDTVLGILGGEVVAETEGAGKPWTCPPLRRQLLEIHNHMFLMHGVWTKSGPGSKSVERLLEQHREDHLSEVRASHAWVDHIHKESR